jgi:integrase
VPVPGELIRLWSDYMHEEYGALESDFVFVNLWGGERGRPLSYAAVNELVVRTRRLLGFHFTAHMLRHYVDGWVMWPLGVFALLSPVAGSGSGHIMLPRQVRLPRR